MYEDKFQSYNNFFGMIFSEVKQQELEKLLGLMHVAVEINDKDWFEELAARYNLMSL